MFFFVTLFFSRFVFGVIVFYGIVSRSPVNSVTMTCHILTVMGDISSNLNDDTKNRIVGKLCVLGLQNVFAVVIKASIIKKNQITLCFCTNLCMCYIDDLMGWLKTFSLPLEVISSCVDALLRFGKSDSTQDTMVRSTRCQEGLNMHHSYSVFNLCVCCFRCSWIASVESWYQYVKHICPVSF